MSPNPLAFTALMAFGMWLSIGRLHFLLAWALTWLVGFLLPSLLASRLELLRFTSPTLITVWVSLLLAGITALSCWRVKRKLEQRTFLRAASLLRPTRLLPTRLCGRTTGLCDGVTLGARLFSRVQMVLSAGGPARLSHAQATPMTQTKNEGGWQRRTPVKTWCGGTGYDLAWGTLFASFGSADAAGFVSEANYGPLPSPHRRVSRAPCGFRPGSRC